MALDNHIVAPEHTAVRVALWRALHVLLDPPPHVLTDTVGESLVAEDGWQKRGDMEPGFSKSMRASVVGRARFIEDLVIKSVQSGVSQYVILGAGLDTFAQRRPEIASKINIFEVDQPGPQQWKKQRLSERGYVNPVGLHFVPVDFEAGQSWWNQLLTYGFDVKKPTIVVSTGVSMYLSKEANLQTLRQVAQLAPGSILAMTFMLELELLETQERAVMEYVMRRAAESETPFKSLFSPEEVLSMAKSVGFKNAEYVSGEDLYQKYFSQRSDGLRAGHAEAFLVSIL